MVYNYCIMLEAAMFTEYLSRCCLALQPLLRQHLLTAPPTACCCLLAPAPCSFILPSPQLRSLSCGPGTFAVAADNSVITWGAATNGELGYGPSGKKSSARPDKVRAGTGAGAGA